MVRAIFRLALRAAVAAIVVLAVVPALASASITGVTFGPDHLSSLAVAPGAVITANVTKAQSGQPNWIDSGPGTPCVNVGSAAGVHQLTVTVPPVGQTLTIRGFNPGGSNCQGEPPAGLSFTVPRDALRIVTPDPNPGLSVKCGLNVMLVLDESASAVNHTRAIRAGALAFLRHLSGTGSHVAITVFSSTATVPELGDGSPYLLVDVSTIADVFRPFIRGDPHGSTPGYNPSAADTGINWQAALDAARAVPAPLVVFITAGDPNTFGTGTSLHTSGVGLALFAAVEAANLVKAHPSHIFAVGVGDAVSRQALQDISGDQEFDGSANGDFALDRFPHELVHTLREEMLALCKSTLTITKVVNNGEGYQGAAGWTVSAELTVPHTWLEPPKATNGRADQVTDDHGTAHFEWRVKTDQRVPLTVDETEHPDYEFASATCHVDAGNGESPEVTFDHLPMMLHVGGNESAICTVRNTLVHAGSNGGVHPPECGDVDSGAPECPSTGGPEGTGPGGTSPGGNGPGEGPDGGIAGATTLTVTKTLPTHGHAGQQVPVTITVRDIGSHTALHVTVHDTPPGAGQLVVAGAHVSTRPDGTVLWTLGDLQPGASVTVHARMLIVRGAGGRLQNTVFAAAANADVVLTRAVVSVPVSHAPLRPRPPAPPRFTG